MKSPASALFAMLHRGHPGDLAFYQQICRDTPRVLELGCGYGRLAWALAAAGCQVVGLDRDPGLLSLAQQPTPERAPLQARLSWVTADMCDFALEGSFQRVVIAYNTLCCLLSPERVAACLAAARRQLDATGMLALDVYHADPMHADAPDDDDDPELVIALEHGGCVYDVYEQSRFDRGRQRLDTSYRFVPRGGGEPIAHTIEQRYLLRAELEQLLDGAGLTIVEQWGGFAGEPLDDDAEHIVIVATPSSAAHVQR